MRAAFGRFCFWGVSNSVVESRIQSMDTGNQKTIDWERIELDYRAGIKTLRQIAEDQGITHGAINKRAKRDGWTRDLAAKIQQKANDLVSRATVSSAVSKEARIAEQEVVEANAHAVATVRLSHRRDIQRSRSIVMRLMDEMDLQSGSENAAMLAELGELMRSPDDKNQDKLNDLYQKIVSLPARAKTMKELSESLRVLVALEREAFGLDVDQSNTTPPEREMSDDEVMAEIRRLTEKAHG